MALRNFTIFYILWWISFIAITQNEGLPLMSSSQENYLKRFGYIDPAVVIDGDAVVQYPIGRAIRQFQRMAGISQTGIIDAETQRMMAMPRCGVPDIVRKRVKRDTGNKWSKNDLTYFFKSYTNDSTTAVIESEVRRALQVWSDVTNVKFQEGMDLMSSDIEISFDRLEHGDRNDFDGPGGILAHAFYPQNGDMHFDDDELWTSFSETGSNLFQVAVHELGHSLGLNHSNVQSAVMAPFYRGFNPNFKLHDDDIIKIQYKYGVKTRPGTTTNNPEEPSTEITSTLPPAEPTGAIPPQPPSRPGKKRKGPKKPKKPKKPRKPKKPKQGKDSSEEKGKRKSKGKVKKPKSPKKSKTGAGTSKKTSKSKSKKRN